MWIFILIFLLEIVLLILFNKFILKPLNNKSDDKKVNIFKSKNTFKRIFSYMIPYKKEYIYALILLFTNVIFSIASPILVGTSIKEIAKDDISLKNIIIYLILGLLCTIIGCICKYIQQMRLHIIGQDIINNIRKEVFCHIQTLSHNQFNNIPVGVLVTRNTSDGATLFQLYTDNLVNILEYISVLLGVLIGMFIINVTLALIIVDIIPIILAVMLYFRASSKIIYRNIRNKVSKMNAFLSENISGMKTTQIFNQEDKIYNEFKESNKELLNSVLKRVFKNSILRPTMFVLYVLCIILVLYYGTNQAIQANFIIGLSISFSDLYVFYEYVGKFFDPIQKLSEQYDQLLSSVSAAEKIFTILDTKSEIVDKDNAQDIDIKGLIEFKHVWFKYEDSSEDDWIIKDVSFTIKPNDSVAFIGATGAGKSTILGLITRNHVIQKGEILIDGVNVNDIKLESLRSQIGQMLQDVFLFSGTIADNIRLNDESITDQDIYEACDEVNPSKFINKLPDGINSIVTEHGSNYSLGEKQLISFARALVHKPKLIILDEATSNIDTETEKIIQDSIIKVMNKNTMVMVAHRLSTIQHAKCIYVFDKGKIIEQGNHQELLAKKGKYYELYLLQYNNQNN